MNPKFSALLSANSMMAQQCYSNSQSRRAAARGGVLPGPTGSASTPWSIQHVEYINRVAEEAREARHENARRNYNQLMEEHRDVMKRTESAPIKLTEKIFRSDKFLACLDAACKLAWDELERLFVYNPMETRKNIAYKIKERGELNANWFLAQGTLIYFGQSKLRHAERDFVKKMFNAALDDYRRQRNADQRANRRVRKMKEQLKAEGITDIIVHKHAS